MCRTKMALIYDFDGTLTPQDSLSYGLFEALDIDREVFWESVESSQMDPHSAGMLQLKNQVEKKGICLTRSWLAQHAKSIQFCPGLVNREWFDHIEHLAQNLNIKIAHFIISAGIAEIIQASVIAPHFDRIFASEFHYDSNGQASWPQHIINSTNKLQFLFRIRKGLFDLGNYLELYEKKDIHNDYIPFENIIFIGDGETDVPCMKVVKDRGGLSLAVYPNSNYIQRAQQLLARNKVHYAFPADYRKKSLLTQKVTQHIIEQSKKNRLPTSNS